MSEPAPRSKINLTTLRALCERPPGMTEWDDNIGAVRPGVLLALIDAVEAAHNLDRVVHRISETWNEEVQEHLIDKEHPAHCEGCALDRALARFRLRPQPT